MLAFLSHIHRQLPRGKRLIWKMKGYVLHAYETTNRVCFWLYKHTSQLIHMDVLLRHCACISIAVKLFVCMRSSDLIRVIIKVSSGMRDRQQNTEQTQYSTAVANTQKIIHCQTERLFL